MSRCPDPRTGLRVSSRAGLDAELPASDGAFSGIMVRFEVGQGKGGCMRRWILLGVMAAVALTAHAAKRVTVAELIQAVTTDSAAHKPDAEIIRQISAMELTERLSEATLDRLNAQVQLSPQVALALELQADQSAFLDLPVSELPALPPPGEDAQLKTFNAAGTFVAETLPHLPNFLATRTTIQYDDSPQEVKKGSWPVRAGLHLVGKLSRDTSVSAERTGTSAGGAQGASQQGGLVSWGEFGSVLGMVLADSANGKVSWSHWEQLAGVRAAVFHYTVPKAASHFEVVNSIRREAGIEGFATHMDGSRIAGIGARQNNSSSQTSVIHADRGYQGSLWVDPATGSILRVTIEANSKDSSAFQWAEMMVEYGPVEIGGGTFILPVRSVAFSRTILSTDAMTGSAPSQWLNETLFNNYHRFVGTTRILTDADAAPAPQKPADSESKPQ